MFSSIELPALLVLVALIATLYGMLIVPLLSGAMRSFWAAS
jgi:hypothetical protein